MLLMSFVFIIYRIPHCVYSILCATSWDKDYLMRMTFIFEAYDLLGLTIETHKVMLFFWLYQQEEIFELYLIFKSFFKWNTRIFLFVIHHWKVIFYYCSSNFEIYAQFIFQFLTNFYYWTLLNINRRILIKIRIKMLINW